MSIEANKIVHLKHWTCMEPDSLWILYTKTFFFKKVRLVEGSIAGKVARRRSLALFYIRKIEIFPVNNRFNRLAKNTTGSTEKLKFR